MSNMRNTITAVLLVIAAASCKSEECYTLYFGNTHSHCNYSGDIAKSKAKKGLGLDPKNTVDNHFKLAKENGYDFYFVTDHSQYDCYTPQAWADVKAKGAEHTDGSFVGLRGYEHSENDGPDGTGHMNVYNSDTYLSALAEGVSIEYFHNWLAKPANKDVIVGFNHPQKNAYNDFHCYNEEARSHIKVMELINGSKPRFYPTFLNALSKGWKVSPVAGCDNHGWEGISKWPARTGLWAKDLTPEGIIEAMASRRTFATMDKNLSVKYTVNGEFMGSDIKTAKKYKFEIDVVEPDTDKEKDKLTKIEVVGEGGKVLASEVFDSHEAHWKPVVKETGKYFFVLVYNASDPEVPAAFTAPVWTE